MLALEFDEFTKQAIIFRVGYFRTGLTVVQMIVMPDFPASTFCQASGTLLPTGLMMPSPVTTTLRRCTLEGRSVSLHALECDLT